MFSFRILAGSVCGFFNLPLQCEVPLRALSIGFLAGVVIAYRRLDNNLVGRFVVDDILPGDS